LSRKRAARRYLVIGVAAATLAIGTGCAAQNAAGSSVATCEIRVFQAGTLNSTSPNALQGGLIPAIIEGAREKKFPTDTVESQMNLALSREAVLDIVKTMPWLRFLDASQVDVGSEKGNLSKSDIRARVDSGKRNTSASKACYLELYASQQDFTGGFIKSHLYSHFTLIDFRGQRPDVIRAIVWSPSSGFPARDEASLPASQQALRQSFADNLRKFLAKKFK
jgi:hypothetical protein